MSSFDELQRLDNALYRGSDGAVANAIMHVAVGPARQVAEYIENTRADIEAACQDASVRFFWQAITGQPLQPHVPGGTLADRVGFILKTSRLTGNVFTPFERVIYEPEGQVNSVRTGRLLESVSENPQVAILYAYGVNPDPWFDAGKCEFWGNGPNADAFVAILPPSKGLSADVALGMVRNIAGVGPLTPDEAKRRMARDSEVLLTSAVVPQKIVQLPALYEKKPLKSLDAAADALRHKHVAV